MAAEERTQSGFAAVPLEACEMASAVSWHWRYRGLTFEGWWTSGLEDY